MNGHDGILDELQDALGYHFTDQGLLRQALTHRSAVSSRQVAVLLAGVPDLLRRSRTNVSNSWAIGCWDY